MNPRIRILTFVMSILALILSLLSLALSRAEATAEQTKPVPKQETKPKNPNVVVLGARPVIIDFSGDKEPSWSRVSTEPIRHSFKMALGGYISYCGKVRVPVYGNVPYAERPSKESDLLDFSRPRFLQEAEGEDKKKRDTDCKDCATLYKPDYILVFPADHPYAIKMAQEKARRDKATKDFQEWLKTHPEYRPIKGGNHRPEQGSVHMQMAPSPAVPPAEKK